MKNQEKKSIYDVAVSFAGEQREYVEKVVKYLEENKVRVFYDKNEQESMWGRDMVSHFEKIYMENAEYIVMFLSKEYATKPWPSYERQVILGRWIEEEGILLPARFDKTKIPGLPDTIGYLNLKGMKPEDLAQAIIRRISPKSDSSVKRAEENKKEYRLPKKVKRVNPYEERNQFIYTVIDGLKSRCDSVQGMFFSHEDVGDRIQIRILNELKTFYALDIYKKGIDKDDGICFSSGERNTLLSGFHAWGHFAWDIDNENAVLMLTDMSLFDGMDGMGESKLNYKEFVDKLWNKIVDLFEQVNS